MEWKKLFVGEKMPDKDDPKYKQRYENEVNAGRKFARMMKLDVLAGIDSELCNQSQKTVSSHCVRTYHTLSMSEYLQNGICV